VLNRGSPQHTGGAFNLRVTRVQRCVGACACPPHLGVLLVGQRRAPRRRRFLRDGHALVPLDWVVRSYR
jgi:hypothetical protein